MTVFAALAGSFYSHSIFLDCHKNYSQEGTIEKTQAGKRAATQEGAAGMNNTWITDIWCRNHCWSEQVREWWKQLRQLGPQRTLNDSPGLEIIWLWGNPFLKFYDRIPDHNSVPAIKAEKKTMRNACRLVSNNKLNKSHMFLCLCSKILHIWIPFNPFIYQSI
jgi:hypothetical protein